MPRTGSLFRISSPGVPGDGGVFDVCSKLGKLGFNDETASSASADSSSSTPRQSRADLPPVVSNEVADKGVTMFEVDTVSSTDSTPVSQWKAVFTHDDGQFYIEAPEKVLSASKNSLISLLELAEELLCSGVWLYIDKSRRDLKALVQTMSFLGFVVSHSKQAKGYVMMHYAYDAEE